MSYTPYRTSPNSLIILQETAHQNFLSRHLNAIPNFFSCCCLFNHHANTADDLATLSFCILKNLSHTRVIYRIRYCHSLFDKLCWNRSFPALSPIPTGVALIRISDSAIASAISSLFSNAWRIISAPVFS